MWYNIKKFPIPTKGEFILGFYENIIDPPGYPLAHFEFTEISLVRWESGKLIEVRTGLETTQIKLATHWMHMLYKFAA